MYLRYKQMLDMHLERSRSFGLSRLKDQRLKHTNYRLPEVQSCHHTQPIPQAHFLKGNLNSYLFKLFSCNCSFLYSEHTSILLICRHYQFRKQLSRKKLRQEQKHTQLSYNLWCCNYTAILKSLRSQFFTTLCMFLHFHYHQHTEFDLKRSFFLWDSKQVCYEVIRYNPHNLIQLQIPKPKKQTNFGYEL